MMLRAFIALGLFLIFHVGMWAGGAKDRWLDSSGVRRFEVRDSIAMARFDPVGGEPEFSPDKRYFAVVTSRGLLASNEIESTLWVFRSDEVREFLHADSAKTCVPRILARLRAIPQRKYYGSYGSLITDVHWQSDSNTILFLGQNSEGMRQLRQVDLSSGVLHTLSPEGYDVSHFEFAAGNIAYDATSANERTAPGEPINSSAWDVTGVPVSSILFPETVTNEASGNLWADYRGKNTRILDSDSGQPIRIPKFPVPPRRVITLSSDGRIAIIMVESKVIPKSWESYIPTLSYLRIDAAETDHGAMTWPAQYAAVDLDSGKVKVLIDAPHGWALGSGDMNQAVWSQHGKKLLLTNTYLPLKGMAEPERSNRLHRCIAAITDLSSRDDSCVLFSKEETPRRYLLSASFGESDQSVVLKFWSAPNRITEERYRWIDGSWQCISRKIGTGPLAVGRQDFESDDAEFSLAIKQDLNTPPALWATDRGTGRSRKVWDPNPQLAAFSLGEASVFRWTDKTGYQWTGALVRPPDYQPGIHYPLVIQTHGFEENEFLTDGPYTTAFAARPLASAGMIVLQMGTRRDHLLTQKEAPDQIEGFISAIDTLARDGLIDREKVGIIGFSRTCYYVESALIKDPPRFRAATISDGIDESYMQFLLFGLAEPHNEELQIYGSPPFGDGLKTWAEHAPGFHLDQIETPVRIEAITPESILDEWEIYASLRKQKKPVDLVYLPGGQHILQKPLERMASQQGDVDWFRFWLQGEEDTDPSKAKQYVLWRQLRKAAASTDAPERSLEN